MIRFYKIWIWTFFIGFALFLLSSNTGIRQNWNPAEQLIIEIISPVQRLVTQSIKTTEEFWLNYFYLVNVRHENRQLKSELDALRMENSNYRELLSTHERLRELLCFRNSVNLPVIAARVIARDPTGWFKSALIDKGTRSGVILNMPVVNASGVVGRVVSVSPNYAKVLLIIDQNSAVDCLVQRSRQRGIVKGLSEHTCKLDYVVKSTDVKPEDVLVTSGLGGVFPKGLPVGCVLNVKEMSGKLFSDIEVRPYVDFSKLEEVLVILRGEEPSKHQKEKK